MVARLVHRYGVADSLFPGARPASLDDVQASSLVLFGLQWPPEAAETSRALRDAAHLESGGERVGFGQSNRQLDWQLLDMGNLDAAAGVLTQATLEIVSRGGRPVLMGGAMAQALDCLDATLQASTHDGVRVVVVSPDLQWTQHACRWGPKVQTVAMGTHDWVPREALARLKQAGGAMLSAYAYTAQGAPAVGALLEAHAGARKPLFVIVDMTSVDMGHAAGATQDNVGGLDPSEFLSIIDAVAMGGQLLGAAVANLAPERDPRGHSERLAAKALLGLVHQSGRGSV